MRVSFGAVCLGASLVLPFLLSGCGSSSPTAIVVAISTDVAIPKDLDSLEVEVRVGSQTPFLQTYSLPSDAKLPGTLTLMASDSAGGDPTRGTLNPGFVPVGSKSDTFRIIVKGKHGVQARISSSASLRFVEDSTKKLAVVLSAACLDVVCADAQTCRAGTCVAEAVDSASLPAGP